MSKRITFLRRIISGVVAVLAAVVFLSVGAGSVYAQVATGTISGTVADSTGAVVPGAKVTVRNVDTGISRALTTNERGRYAAPELQLGSYEITVGAEGFQTVVRSGINLTVGQEAVLNITLPVGAVTETIEVTGEAPLVETTTSATSGLVSEATVRELPLNGRSFTDLMDLQPNVKKLVSIGAPQRAFGFGAEFSVSGSNPGENNYILDGLLINDSTVRTPGSAAGGMLGTDTIREFRMLSSNYSAEYGQVSGGIMVAVTKSGTNTFHGSAFEFLRNSALDARSFFDQGGVKPFKRNQFGFTVEGPVRKDHTFFFGSYEGLRQRLATTAIVKVPTEAARHGILPTVACAAGCAVGAVAQKILNLYPASNVPGSDHGDGTADFNIAPSNPTTENYFTGRLDHNVNEKNFMFGRYTFDQGDVGSIDNLGMFNNSRNNRYQHAMVSFTSLLTADLLATLRAGVVRSRQFGGFEQIGSADLSPLIHVAGRDPGNITITGVQGIGTDSLSPTGLWWTSFQYGGDVSLTRGDHSLKAGGSIQRNWDNRDRRFSFTGTYGFTSIEKFYAQSPQTLNTATQGADAQRGLRNWVNAFYLTDDWKALSNLTLNLGVRFEFNTVPSEVNNRIATLPNIFTDPTTTTGGPFFKVNSAFAHAAPRFGFAWDPFRDGKTSVRGGVGIFQQAIRSNEWSNASDRMHPFYATTLLTTSTALPLIYPDAFANFGVPGRPPLQPRLDALAFQLSQPYKATWSVNVQREILTNMMVNVGYVGSRGIDLLLASGDVNQPASILSADGRIYIPLGTPRRNTGFTQIRFRDSGHDSYYHALQLSVQKRFSRGFQFTSSYHWSKSVDTSSIVVSQGTDFQGNADQEQYPFDTKANRGLSSWDLRHYWTTNYLVDLPFGPQHALGGSLTGWAGKLAGGWSLSGVFSVNSGPPFTAALAFDYAAAQPQSGGGGLRPDLAPGFSLNPVNGNYHDNMVGASFIPYFDANAFVLPPLTPQCAATPTATGCPRRVFGTVGRTTLVAPGLVNFDFSLLKNTKLTEATQIQFRAEFFNVFNHASFGIPDNSVFQQVTGVRNPTAGRITRQATNPRQIQFGLKFTF